VRAGARARDVDAAARDLLAGMSLAEHFGHSLGHGVGLEVHEEPRVSSASDEILRSGSIITIEPGVYLAGELGVRIEDLVVVEESAGRLLSHAPKGLIEIV
jgi:Xaa-Pro aminopeptidase